MFYFIEVAKDVKLFVKEEGEGNPIVFISGWPFDHRTWEYQFNQLSKKFRCIGIDMRGYGFSDRPEGEYNYDVFADDIHTALQALNITDAVLVGHSMGGAISLHYVAKYPNEKAISKLMLCGPAAPRLVRAENSSIGMSKEEVDNLSSQCDLDRAKLLSDFGKKFFYQSISPELSNWFWIIGMEASPYATAMCIEMLKKSDLSEDMAKIKIPTLIAWGKNDKICSYDFAEVLNKNIKNSSLVTFEESGHGLFYDERDKFNKTLEEFAIQQKNK